MSVRLGATGMTAVAFGLSGYGPHGAAYQLPEKLPDASGGGRVLVVVGDHDQRLQQADKVRLEPGLVVADVVLQQLPQVPPVGVVLTVLGRQAEQFPLT